MPAGFKYDLKTDAVERELCNQKTIYRLAGGFNLKDDEVENGNVVPHLAPLSIDFKKREAVVVKNVRAVEAISATTLKVAKGHFIKAGMHIGNGKAGATVSAIDKANANYDTLTLSATIEGVKAGDVLFQAKAVNGKEPKHIANYLNYARVKMEDGATITAVGQAYEIKEDKLYLPVSEKDKEMLGARFMFV
ncbi:head fiber protein [Capnocytophaga sp.]|uniref:head fiber protein n=1 Tax=Capnocytophaga sp. TaxID=44737 RepID=UPI0026DC9025|nr:head fiber protein [Capnocytophaga sp.]MDO5106032.1 head fiber protein [Capnocytophaga sp.]